MTAQRRVRVLGTSGAGKTTFARRLARRIGVPHLELDALFHQPGWEPADDDAFASGLAEWLAQAPDGWVVDGNYRARTADVTARADTVVWLDHPRWLVTSRVVRRTLARVLLRRELWNGNRERLVNLVTREPAENIVLWSWRTFAPNREQLAAAADARWVRLRGGRAARRWLRGVPGPDA